MSWLYTLYAVGVLRPVCWNRNWSLRANRVVVEVRCARARATARLNRVMRICIYTTKVNFQNSHNHAHVITVGFAFVTANKQVLCDIWYAKPFGICDNILLFRCGIGFCVIIIEWKWLELHFRNARRLAILLQMFFFIISLWEIYFFLRNDSS